MIEIKSRICTKCGALKPLTEYHRDIKGVDGRRARCKDCVNGKVKPSGNVLVVGDLHAPFVREGYLDFCRDIYDKYNCSEVVFIGDVIDNHFSSFHTTDPDGYGAGEELDRAVDILRSWHKEFPGAKVILGNHDLIISRKLMDAGVSKRWNRKIADVLEVYTWEFVDSYIKDGVMYVHGGNGKAHMRAKRELTSVVQGHYHSEAYIMYFVGLNYKIFGMQVGCGVDDRSYAMAYGKNSPRSAIGCGVVLNNGKQGIIELMEL